MRSIVIDDSRVIRMMLRKILEGLGFSVTEFDTADSAFAWLNAGNSADLALIDWNMPGMSGLDLIIEIRKDRRHEQMYLVMVTSETAPEKMQLALNSGADEYVMKPVVAAGLREKLEMLGFRWAPGVGT
jgi:two-component system chemotaxis response regulator CheY